MTRKYNEVQLTYITARAAYDTAAAAVEAEMQPYEALLDSEAGIEEYCKLEEQAGLKYDRYEFAALLSQAEQCLIDWSFSVVARLPQYKRYAAEIEPVKALAQKRATVREQLVKLAMQLEA